MCYLANRRSGAQTDESSLLPEGELAAHKGREIMAPPHTSSYVSNGYFVQHEPAIFVLTDKPSRSLLNAEKLV
jgi:hypothetical protein